MTPEQIKAARARAYACIAFHKPPSLKNCHDVLALAHEVEALQRQIENMKASSCAG